MLVDLQNRIRERWQDRVNVTFSLRSCLEVMAGVVSKGKPCNKLRHFKVIKCMTVSPLVMV